MYGPKIEIGAKWSLLRSDHLGTTRCTGMVSTSPKMALTNHGVSVRIWFIWLINKRTARSLQSLQMRRDRQEHFINDCFTDASFPDTTRRISCITLGSLPFCSFLFRQSYRLWAGGPVVRITAGEIDLYLFRNVQTRPGAHPPSYSKGNTGSSPGVTVERVWI